MHSPEKDQVIISYSLNFGHISTWWNCPCLMVKTWYDHTTINGIPRWNSCKTLPFAPNFQIWVIFILKFLATCWQHVYALVICYIAIENGHRNRGFTHWKWWFFTVMLVYQRASCILTIAHKTRGFPRQVEISLQYFLALVEFYRFLVLQVLYIYIYIERERLFIYPNMFPLFPFNPFKSPLNHHYIFETWNCFSLVIWKLSRWWKTSVQGGPV